ncbi:lipoyl synthase [archaeon]|nr:lipoyl synthase [archaeon]
MNHQQKPDWLTIRPPSNKFDQVTQVLKKHQLKTVCAESHCPNIAECWSGGTATFMVMGDTCTRGCRFCTVKTSSIGKPLDEQEPEKLVKAIKELEIFDYIVLTSVDRDDLADQGSMHIAKCIKAIKEGIPSILVEVLIPDFQGNSKLIQNVIDSKPDVIAHNIETVKSLQNKVRDPRAGYEQSLKVLKIIKEKNPKVITKSSIMVGLGETSDEVVQTMKDLRSVDVNIITFGQYLQPSKQHLEVVEYVHPDKFLKYKELAKELGFKYVASGPFVRSSYKAGELFVKHQLKQ